MDRSPPPSLPDRAGSDGRTCGRSAWVCPKAGAILTVDLAAIRANYRTLRDRAAPARVAAVVKADAYGLGASMVAPALVREGCDDLLRRPCRRGNRTACVTWRGA